MKHWKLEARQRKMNSLNSLLVLVLMPFYLISANETNQSAITVSSEEVTDNPSEYYEQPQSSEEAFKEYNNFQTAFARQYRLSPQIATPPSVVELVSVATKSDGEPIEQESESLISENDDVDELAPATTFIVPTEQSPAAIQSLTSSSDLSETVAKLIVNSTNTSDIMTIADTNKTESLSNKHGKMYLANEPDDEPVYHALSLTDNVIRKVTANTYNNSPSETVDGDSSNIDYVNDGSDSETNNSQPNTAQYYPLPVDTTIASIVPLSIQIQSTDRSPIYTAAATAIVTTTASTTTTTTINAQNLTGSKKFPKKIDTTSRIYKYIADEVVRKYLDDPHIRAPIATIINTSPDALRKAKILWKSTLRPNTPIDIVFLAFNSSGVGVTYTFKNTRTMLAGLESLQESRETIAGGSGFFAIMRALELVPYDSAIFMSTDKIPHDINLVRYVATKLLKKRIRLYLLWFGGSMSAISDDQNETSVQIGGVLGDVAIRSGGEVFRITEEPLGNGDLGLVTHLLLNDIQGAHVLDIPINTTASNVQIKINGNVDQATLTTPNGVITIDLLDAKSVENYSPGSFIIDQCENEIRVYLHMLDLDAIGMYTLRIIRHLSDETNQRTSNRYSVTVREDFRNQFELKSIGDDNQWHAASTRMRRSETHLERQREVIEWPEDDNEIGAEIDDLNEVTPDDHMPINHNFTEITARSGKNTLQSETRIELGAQSQLLAVAGSTVQIYYEITNLRMIPTLHNFQVIDEQRFLQSLNPPSMWLPPGQTSSAVVTCIIPPNTEIGVKDKITFTSQGLSQEIQPAILTVISAQSQGLDRRPPIIWWNYGSRCDGRLGSGQCAGAIWSLEITTADYDTGILRVQSTPKGLIIRNLFTAGTREEVKATYSASCCTPRVTITSYDLAGNQRTISVDVTEYILGPVEIAAIVLGVILIIIILGIIIALIVYCCKKRKEVRELPVYRSRSERERERTT